MNFLDFLDEFNESEVITNIVIVKSELTRQQLVNQKKKLGNINYRNRDFQEALVHYNSAKCFKPMDMTSYTNIADFYYEQ